MFGYKTTNHDGNTVDFKVSAYVTIMSIGYSIFNISYDLIFKSLNISDIQFDNQAVTFT